MKRADFSGTVSFELPESPEPFKGLLWTAEVSERGLRRLSFVSSKSAKDDAKVDGESLTPFQTKFIARLKKKLLGRLKGGRDDFEWDEFDLEGAGAFHVRVWKAMREIPAGKTATYGETAGMAGSPMAFRACGQACGANRILVFIPCHRVVASSGLGGFGYGVEWKKKLLGLESGK